MINYSHLVALAAVLEEQGFEKAADRLAITQSAVSQRVRKLESSVGHRLLVRSTPPALTRHGELVLAHYQQVSHLQHDLGQQLSGADNSWQRLALGSNADSLATWLPDALDPLLESHHLLLDLQIDDQDQTHEMLRRGEVLGCISSSPQAIAGCNCIPLGIMVYRGLVAPGFRDRHFPGGMSREAMQQAPCVEFNADDDLQRRYLKRYFQLDYQNPRHRVPSAESFLNFIARGRAWGLAPDLQARAWLDAGKLEELVPGNTLEVPLYWHIWNLQTRLHRELTDHLCREAARVMPAIMS